MWPLAKYRTFSSPKDFNLQLGEWLERANNRNVRAIAARPNDLISEDRRSMISLPPIPPLIGECFNIRLPRDDYVRVAGNDYFSEP